jgi:sarcosine oxidase
VDRRSVTDVITSACPGYGYTFASVIGDILADLATEDATRHPIKLFLPARVQ